MVLPAPTSHQVFLTALAESKLRDDETEFTRKFHRRLANENPALYAIFSGVFGMGHDVSGKLRDSDGRPISSHWYRMVEMSLRRNYDYINDDNLGRYVLRAVLNAIHDIAEERTTNELILRGLKGQEWNDGTRQEASRIRNAKIAQTKEELLELIDSACIATGISLTGGSQYERLFGGIRLLDIIDKYFDVYTPGYKISPGIGKNSAIQVGHNITRFDDKESLEAALVLLEPKLNDRIDNGPNIFPVTREWQQFFGVRNLQKRVKNIRENPLAKDMYVALYEEQEKQFEEKKSRYKVIPADRRATELFKLGWMASQAIELFDHSRAYESDRIATMRRPAVRAVREALENLCVAAPRHAHSLVAYTALPRDKIKQTDGSPLPQNDAEAYAYLQASAQQYWDIPGSHRFQGNPGTYGLEIFHGTMAHMAAIEANIGTKRKKFKRDPFDNLIRTTLLQQIGNNWLPPVEAFEAVSNVGGDLRALTLDYLPGLYTEVRKLLREKKP